MTRVCVVGSVNMDIGFDVDTLPRPGETVLAASFRSTPGGKGANQAVAAARAGAQVQFVGAVGDDPAAAPLREHLTANGVGTDGLITVPGPSGSAVVVVDSAGENLIVVAPGANSRLTLDSAALRGLVVDCDVLLLQLEIPVTTATAAAREAHSAGATVIVNASPSGGDPGQLAELAEATDVVVVNEAEAAQWVWPVPHRVITRGARGASYAGGGEELTVAPPAVKVGRHLRRRRRVRRRAGRGLGQRPRPRVAPGLRRRRAGDFGARRRGLRTVCRGDRRSDCWRTDQIAEPDGSRRKGETQCRQPQQSPETMAAHARPRVTGWERRT